MAVFVLLALFGFLVLALCRAAGRKDRHLMYRKLSPEAGRKIEEALEEEPLGVGA